MPVRSLVRCLVVVVASSACGGNSRSTLHDSPGGASGSGTAGVPGSGGTAANPEVGGTRGNSEGGAGAVSSSAGRPGSSGSGGKQPDGAAGAPADLSCSTAYRPPTGGPRLDGPASLIGCEGISDDVIIERFKEHDNRVPEGLYFEGSESIVFWSDPCSESLRESVMRGPTDNEGELEAESETRWFYEASYCYNGVRRRERHLRCDYFDGSTLGDLEPQDYAFFASLLWWRSHASVSGGAILGASVTVGGATDRVELCTIEGSRGDFGLCDEVRLLRTRHLIMATGEVELGTPELLRTVTGDCR